MLLPNISPVWLPSAFPYVRGCRLCLLHAFYLIEARDSGRAYMRVLSLVGRHKWNGRSLLVVLGTAGSVTCLLASILVANPILAHGYETSTTSSQPTTSTPDGDVSTPVKLMQLDMATSSVGWGVSTKAVVR